MKIRCIDLDMVIKGLEHCIYADSNYDLTIEDYPCKSGCEYARRCYSCDLFDPNVTITSIELLKDALELLKQYCTKQDSHSGKE